MERCGGIAVVHLDGSFAACTEELLGRACAGPGAQHAEEVSCEALTGPGGCEHCEVVYQAEVLLAGNAWGSHVAAAEEVPPPSWLPPGA
jgi:hypothetical protein